MRRAGLILLLWAGFMPAFAQLSAVQEIRYCGQPRRGADGSILRSTAVLSAFKRTHACPSTGLRFGPCPGWAIDHILPLASCGCDAVWNLQWLPNELKSAAGALPKDRWERRVYTCPVS